MNEITAKDFWTRFWRDTVLPQRVDPNFKNDRVIGETLKKYLPTGTSNTTAFEVGCAPGKWIIFLNEELHYGVVDGCEYLEAAASKTIDNLKMNGIAENKATVFVGDFTKLRFSKLYDVVLSLGFIEHFETAEAVLDKHVERAASQGFVAIGIPNFRYVNKYIQSKIDKYNEMKILPNHNLGIMNLGFFRKYARQRMLQVKFLGYVGGFEHALFDSSTISNPSEKTIVEGIISFFKRRFSRINTPFTSGYIMCILKKEGD